MVDFFLIDEIIFKIVTKDKKLYIAIDSGVWVFQ